jgi:hypothetical protein
VTSAPGRTLRATAALALAGFAVHQARYAIVPAAHDEPGHAYLHAVAPIVLALLAALALGRSLAGLAARRTDVAPASPVARWLASSAALLVLHAAQEGAERVLAGGGPIDRGALLAVPLCLLAGALVALTLRHADELLARAASPPRAPRTILVVPLSVLLPVAPVLARTCAQGTHRAGRAPPALG